MNAEKSILVNTLKESYDIATHNLLCLVDYNFIAQADILENNWQHEARYRP